MPGDYRVLHERRTRFEQRHAQIAYAHPGAAGQFEIFGKATIKEQPLRGVARINKFYRIPRTEKALVIKLVALSSSRRQ